MGIDGLICFESDPFKAGGMFRARFRIYEIHERDEPPLRVTRCLSEFGCVRDLGEWLVMRESKNNNDSLSDARNDNTSKVTVAVKICTVQL